MARTRQDITYDGRYFRIRYPGGDVPAHLGVCTDVIIRSYRAVGIVSEETILVRKAAEEQVLVTVIIEVGEDSNVDTEHFRGQAGLLGHVGERASSPFMT